MQSARQSIETLNKIGIKDDTEPTKKPNKQTKPEQKQEKPHKRGKMSNTINRTSGIMLFFFSSKLCTIFWRIMCQKSGIMRESCELCNDAQYF